MVRVIELLNQPGPRGQEGGKLSAPARNEYVNVPAVNPRGNLYSLSVKNA